MNRLIDLSRSVLVPFPFSPALSGSRPAAAPLPMTTVATATASLRDDVGCIWAQTAGSLSPSLTALGADCPPSFSPGPSLPRQPTHPSPAQPSLRPHTHGKPRRRRLGRELETLSPKKSSIFSEMCSSGAAAAARLGGFTKLMLVESDSSHRAWWSHDECVSGSRYR